MKAEDLSLNILIVDDDEDDFFITSEYLKNIPAANFNINWCYKYEEAVERVMNNEFDIYFVDYLLGAKTGLDLIKIAVDHKIDQPFILLTGKGNPQVDRQAMQAGAVDYLIKNELDSEKLERCIRYSVERSRSLKAIKANEKKYRNMFERSADAVFLADIDLYFRDINDATTRLFEYEKEELLAMSLYDLVQHADQIEALKSELQEKEDVDNKEIILKTKQGVAKYCILSLSQENDNDGPYYQGIIHDITALKKAEKATLRTEKQGVAGRLVQILAHEVRNPLNNINLSLEQISPETSADESKVFLDIIHRNSKRIESLIKELLNSSRPAQLVQQPTELQDVINESIATAQDRLTLKKIRLIANITSTPLTIQADPEKLKIALLNIIINAVEAMEADMGVLEITLERTEDNALLTIKDNGCGISDENLSKLFEPYFTAKRNGMGLGLATTLNILQSHNVDVEVQSRLGEGTSFILTFNHLAEATGNLQNIAEGSV